MPTRSAVLIVDSDRKELARISRVVRSVVPTAQAVSALDEADSLDDFDLIVAAYDGLSAEERTRLFERVDTDCPDCPRLLLVSSTADEYERLFLELDHHSLTNVLAQDGAISATDLIVTAQKLLRRDIFGLDKYFGWGVDPTRFEIGSSKHTHELVDEVSRFATSLNVPPRLVENVETVVDELITNALYNAPVDASGAPRFAHLPRTTPVELEPGELVTLEYCCDGHTFGVSVTDPFGAMTKQQSLDYLAKCLRRTDDEPSTEKGGAGLGLYMTFGSLNHLVLNICQGVKTEVIGLIDIRGSYRDFVQRGKSFNIFLDNQDDR